MRIGLITEQLLAPVPGGTGRYTRELSEGLVRTAATGDELTGWTAWHADRSAARITGLVQRRLPLPRRPLAAAWERGWGPAPRGAELVHAMTLLLPPVRVPLVVTIHDVVPWTHPETLTPRGARWHRSMAERAVRAGAHIVTPTAVVADQLREVLPIQPERLHPLGAGVSAALRRDPGPVRTAEVLARFGIEPGYLLSLATLEPRKGLDVLLDALAELGAAAPVLVVVGPRGWGDIDLDTEIRRRGLPSGRVRALGRIDDADLAVVLRAARMLAMPSRAEGFGLPVAEAMATGTPVVCSDAPALVEVAGSAALVVPRGDSAALAQAIRGVWHDESRLTALAEAGIARSAEFDWDAVAGRAWTLYREIAEG